MLGPHVGAGEHVAAAVEAISAGSQAVSASAPMKMNRPPDSSWVVSPVAELQG